MSKKSRRVAKARRALLALSLVLATMLVTVGGTIAWLTDKTTEVKNVFTPAGIDIDLKETKKPDGTEVPAGVTDWSAELIPGKEYQKNPVVSVVRSTNDKQGTDVDIYLFVKFEPGTTATYLDYTMNWTGWSELETVSTGAVPVYYRIVKKTDTDISWNLITDNKVTVKSSLVKGNDEATDSLKMPADDIDMKFTAYAIQADGFATISADGTTVTTTNDQAVKAWQEINPTTVTE